MRSDEYLKQAMAEIREPVPEDLERWVLELARTAPVPTKITGLPWHWILVLSSFAPLILVLGVRYTFGIADTLHAILTSGFSGFSAAATLGIPAAAVLIPAILYSLLSYRNTLRLRAMFDPVL